MCILLGDGTESLFYRKKMEDLEETGSSHSFTECRWCLKRSFSPSKFFKIPVEPLPSRLSQNLPTFQQDVYTELWNLQKKKSNILSTYNSTARGI